MPAQLAVHRAWLGPVLPGAELSSGYSIHYTNTNLNPHPRANPA